MLWIYAYGIVLITCTKTARSMATSAATANRNCCCLILKADIKVMPLLKVCYGVAEGGPRTKLFYTPRLRSPVASASFTVRKKKEGKGFFGPIADARKAAQGTHKGGGRKMGDGGNGEKEINLKS